MTKMNIIAKHEIAALRHRNAPAVAYRDAAEYHRTAADRLEAEYKRDLAAWVSGKPARPDLADPRDPRVAAVRAETLERMRETARLITEAADARK